jgi:uncharacterized membrane protein YbhN (UPF0104 family)
MIGLAGLHLTGGNADPRLVLLGAGVLALTLGIMVFPVRFSPRRTSWGNTLVRILDGWHDLAGNRPLLIKAMVYRLGIFGLFFISCGLCLRDLGCDVSVFAVLAMAATVEILTTLALSPNIIGLAEGAIVLSAAILGIDTGEALALAVALRIARTCALLFFVPWVVTMRRRNEQQATDPGGTSQTTGIQEP